MTDRKSAGKIARPFLIAAGALGFLAVALGAFGAHGLKAWLAEAPDGAKRLAWWETGVDYHFWHTLLLASLGLLAERAGGRLYLVCAGFLGAGILLFSGSLYVMTLTGITWLGAITPFGGTAFLVAWVLFAVAAARSFGR